MGARLLTLGVLVVAGGVLTGPSPSAPTVARTPAAAPPSSGSASHARACPVPDAFRAEFEAAAADARLPLELLVAVAKVESNLRPDARSPAGAHGLLQVLPSTAAELELDVYAVGENVLAGARYLRQMLDRFGSADLALAAYNAGPSAVEREGARPYDETAAYVAKVTATWRKLVGCA